MTNRQDILKRWRLLRPYLDGRQRNLWAAAEAAVIGQGSCTSLADITGLSSTTISTWKRKLQLGRKPCQEPLRSLNGLLARVESCSK